MPVFDDGGRLVSLREEERRVLPGHWPAILALYLRLPMDDRPAAWKALWREQVALHPEWKDYRAGWEHGINGYIRWLFEEHSTTELAKHRAEEDALGELDVLPNLTRNCLVRNGIRSGAEVRAKTDQELLSLRNFGVGNLRYARQQFPYSPPERRDDWQWGAI